MRTVEIVRSFDDYDAVRLGVVRTNLSDEEIQAQFWCWKNHEDEEYSGNFTDWLVEQGLAKSDKKIESVFVGG